MGFVLFLVSIILGAVLFSFSLVFTPIYYLITLKWKTGGKKLNRYFYLCALAVDQLGNRLTSEVLNVTLLKKRAGDFLEVNKEDEILDTQLIDWPGMEFGEVDDTISYVLGVNYYTGNLTKVGLFLVRLLNILEKYHVERALCYKYLTDLDGALRLHTDFYYRLDTLRTSKDPKLVALVYEILSEAPGQESPKDQNKGLRDLDNLEPRTETLQNIVEGNVEPTKRGTPKPPLRRKG